MCRFNSDGSIRWAASVNFRFAVSFTRQPFIYVFVDLVGLNTKENALSVSLLVFINHPLFVHDKAMGYSTLRPSLFIDILIYAIICMHFAILTEYMCEMHQLCVWEVCLSSVQHSADEGTSTRAARRHLSSKIRWWWNVGIREQWVLWLLTWMLFYLVRKLCAEDVYDSFVVNVNCWKRKNGYSNR